MNNKPVTTVGLLIAVAIILGGLALYFSLHHCSPAPPRGGGCCCCGGGSNGGGANTTGGSGPGKFGNPGATIMTGTGIMSGLPISQPPPPSTPYDGLIHIHLDPATANPPNSPMSFTVSYASNGPALTMKQGNTMIQPIQVNSTRTITYTGTDTVTYTIAWPTSSFGQATLTTNYPPVGYPGGSSDYSGTYSFNGGIGNITIH